jgi:hypothetical protein
MRVVLGAAVEGERRRQCVAEPAVALMLPEPTHVGGGFGELELEQEAIRVPELL